MATQWIPAIGDRFVLAYDRFGAVHAVSKRTKTKGQIFIYDEHNKRHPIEQCHQYSPEAPLSDIELKTMIDTCEAIVEAGDAENLAMLECLMAEQKIQVWAAITPELRDGLKALRGKVAA